MLCVRNPLPKMSTPSSRSGASARPRRTSSVGHEPRHRHLEHGHVGVGIHRHERDVGPVIEAALRIVGARDAPLPAGARAPGPRARGRPVTGTASGSTARGTRRSRRRAAPAAWRPASSVAPPSAPRPSGCSSASASPSPTRRARPSTRRRRAAPALRAPRRSRASARSPAFPWHPVWVVMVFPPAASTPPPRTATLARRHAPAAA